MVIFHSYVSLPEGIPGDSIPDFPGNEGLKQLETADKALNSIIPDLKLLQLVTYPWGFLCSYALQTSGPHIWGIYIRIAHGQIHAQGPCRPISRPSLAFERQKQVPVTLDSWQIFPWNSPLLLELELWKRNIWFSTNLGGEDPWVQKSSLNPADFRDVWEDLELPKILLVANNGESTPSRKH